MERSDAVSALRMVNDSLSFAILRAEVRRCCQTCRTQVREGGRGGRERERDIYIYIYRERGRERERERGIYIYIYRDIEI